MREKPKNLFFTVQKTSPTTFLSPFYYYLGGKRDENPFELDDLTNGDELIFKRAMTFMKMICYYSTERECFQVITRFLLILF